LLHEPRIPAIPEAKLQILQNAAPVPFDDEIAASIEFEDLNEIIPATFRLRFPVDGPKLLFGK
jgi:hypothetical protein